jgi:hypothetical protein
VVSVVVIPRIIQVVPSLEESVDKIYEMTAEEPKFVDHVLLDVLALPHDESFAQQLLRDGTSSLDVAVATWQWDEVGDLGVKDILFGVVTAVQRVDFICAGCHLQCLRGNLNLVKVNGLVRRIVDLNGVLR